MPSLPADFTRQQLEELRILLIIAKGEAETQSQLLDDSRVNRKQISAFLTEGGTLDFNHSQRPRPMLEAVYEGVHQTLMKDRYGILGLIKPIIHRVYSQHDSALANDDPAWWQIDKEIRRTALIDETDSLRPIIGVYRTFRKGTGYKAGGEIVTSAMRVYERGAGEERRFSFDIAYPVRSDPNGQNEPLITGDILATQAHLHFFGFDRGSRSPYLMIATRPPSIALVSDLFGIAMRATTNAVAFGSRFYACRTDLPWKEALTLPAISSSLEFMNQEKSDDKIRILEYISNKINNEDAHILRIYER